MKIFFYCAVAMVGLYGCGNKIDEIDAVINDATSPEVERGRNIKIIYSDSAQVRMVIYAPVMERVVSYNNGKDVFPKGIQLDFIDESGVAYSHLKADHAVREDNSSSITARGNVIFYNELGEKLESPELVWNEVTRTVNTEKIVRIIQAQKGDTLVGFGFTANQDFSKFEIKRKVQGKINVADLMTELR
jgi:LPS export ABC transporter protein LptC